MKKRPWLIPAITALILSGCGRETDPTPQLYSNGLEMVQTLDAMAESSEYVQLFSTNEEIAGEIANMGQPDYSSPQAVYRVDNIQFSTGEAIPEELAGELDAKMLMAIPSQINSQLGVSTLAATSVITATSAFQCEELTESCMLVFAYNNNYTPVVTFVPGDEGAVLANGSLVATGALLDVSSPEAVREMLMTNGGIADCTVQEITLE